MSQHFDIFNDQRVVMTLDAGGTNFAFSALQGGREIAEPFVLPSNSHDLDQCPKTLIDGFQTLKSKLKKTPVAISFAFPRPADYKNEIIGDLPNFTSFRGGVALGPMLSEIFDLPTFINNDGNLFTYGEAVAGMLPSVNNQLKSVNHRFNNLIGIAGNKQSCGHWCLCE